MKAKKTLFCFLLFLILFLLSCIYFEKKEYSTLETATDYIEKQEALTFSEESGYYSKNIKIELDSSTLFDSGIEIYYTLDGNDPTEESNLYEKPIELELVQNQTTYYPLKAVLYDGSTYSDIYEATYVLGNDIEQDIPIISLTCDEYSLYDDDYGIITNYDQEGDEWHRDSHAVMFDTDGSILLDQDIQIGVGGGTSSAYDIKSLKLYADETFDEDHPKLVLESLTKTSDYDSLSFVDEFNSIRLRSGSQDMYYGNIRSSVVSQLAQESNFDGYFDSQRCLVILNGKVYGVFDMQENYSNSFLKKRYGLEGDDVIVRYKGSEYTTFLQAGVYDYFFNDLNVEANRILLEKYVDMDSYLLYYGLNILWNNTDWPGNNFSCFKYTGEQSDNPYSDGRLRFLIYDTDLVYYTEQNHEYFEGASHDNLDSLMNKLYRASDQTTFGNVMECDYYRNRMITLLCDLLNGPFEENHILDIIDDEYSQVKEVMQDSNIDAYNQSDYYIDLLKQAVEQRDDCVRYDLQRFFNCYSTYDFELNVGDGIVVTWNNMEIYANESYSCDYYGNVTFDLTANVYDGYTFDYFLVNGKKYTDEIYTINLTDILNGKLEIKVVAHRNNEPCLIIDEISAKSDQDFYKIANVGGASINLKNYYITDTLTDLKKFQLPDVELGTDETIILNGKKNYYAIGNYMSNFNLNSEETLYITDGKKIIDALEVPNMTKYETYGRYDHSPIYKYFNNDENQRKVSDY